MPTKPLLKAIFISSWICLVLSVFILIIIGKTKFLEPVAVFFISILFLTLCINGVFYKELVLKGVYYKGVFPIFIGLATGLFTVVLLLTKVFTK